MPLMAVMITGPPRQNEPRKRSCQMCSTSNGSKPTSQSLKLRAHSASPALLPESATLPQPTYRHRSRSSPGKPGAVLRRVTGVDLQVGDAHGDVLLTLSDGAGNIVPATAQAICVHTL